MQDETPEVVPEEVVETPEVVPEEVVETPEEAVSASEEIETEEVV